ncbi:hypothetical protein ABC795_04620 [Blastococcus sp. HT6-30]|uniref:hypothetical protein n=1 Tax=Blastococcus sp. HT6-30 TaxID=3144843 RepID=UPI00321BBB2E
MTNVDDRTVPATGGGVWRPYADEPVLTPTMVLGWEATPPEERERLARYLSALVAARGGPVHVNVAFNGAYFGYDLTAGGYVGGPLDLFAFPQVRFGEITDALPVGALVNIDAGEQPLFAEVVYKEGAHPSLSDDGAVPAWLSGAPAGATGPGTADVPPGGSELRELLVVDVDAFGADFSASQARLDRLRHRGRWLNGDGHLLLDARYASRRDADLDEAAFYARYLLTRGRDQLLSAAAPMPLSTVLSDEAGEQELAAALDGLLETVAAALASLPELRMWRGYAFTRSSLAARLDDPGPLGGGDLSSVAVQLARTAMPLRAGRARRVVTRPDQAPAAVAATEGEAPSTVTFTAVGPRLRMVRDAGAQLIGLGYVAAVCHANAVISDYARREVDEKTGLLPGGVHLRLDDPWQGGGVWRAEHPASRHSHVDPLVPLGLGWQSTLPEPAPAPTPPTSSGEGTPAEPPAETDVPAEPVSVFTPQSEPEPDVEPEPAPEPTPAPELAPEPTPALTPVLSPPVDDENTHADDLVVTDSQVTWTQALRLSHLLEGRLPLPDRIGTQLRDAGLSGVRLRLLLTHDGNELDRDEATQDVASELFPRPQLQGVEWPLDFFAGIRLTCTWPRGKQVIRAMTTLLEMPVTVDGMEIEHQYDPRILTHDTAPGQPRYGGSGPAGTLTLTQRVLRAVRIRGLLDPDGRAVLARSLLPEAVYGSAGPAGAGELDIALDELVAAGALHTDVGSVGTSRWIRYPAQPGDPTVPLIVYEPRPVAGPPRAVARRTSSRLDARFVRHHHVAGHLRWIGDLGREAGEEARAAYREDRLRFGLAGPAELPEGYTYVKPFVRGRA